MRSSSVTVQPGLTTTQPRGTLHPFAVRDADDGGLRDGRMGHDEVLQVDGGDPLAAALDEVFRPVHETDVALFVDRPHIARVKPASLEDRLRPFGILVVFFGDPGSPEEELAPLLPVGLHFLTLFVDDLHLETGCQNAGAGFDIVKLIS